MDHLERILLPITATLRDVMAALNASGVGITLIVDEQRRLITTVTDGDVRRALLGGHAMQDVALDIVQVYKGPAFAQPVVARVGASPAEMARILQDHQLEQLPVLDAGDRVADLVLLRDLPALMQKYSALPVRAVIMAGGKGQRLRPLTDSTPKPLLPVGDKPLLERIVELMQRSGVEQVTITTHYYADQIMAHFGDGGRYGLRIGYTHEPQPMGTAGALALLDDLDAQTPLLVINGDVLTTMDLHAFHAFHANRAAELTVGVSVHEMQVPYGVVRANRGGRVLRLEEKPQYQFLINAGVYLLSPSALAAIPRGQPFDMTDLITALVQDDRPVFAFPIHEYWLDIGQLAQYEQAQLDVKNGRL